MSRFCRVVVAALALVFFTAGPAAAHPLLTGSEPADGQTLAAPPDRLSLEFSEALLASSVRVSLHPSAGAASDLTTSAQTPTRFVAPLPRLGDDIYEVRWEATSSEDGHTLSGSLVFGVQRAVAASAPGERGGPQALDSALALARVAGASLAVGGFLVAVLLVPLARRRRPSGPWTLVTRRALRVASAGAATGVLAVIAIGVASSAWQVAAAAHGRRLIEQLALLLTGLIIAHRTHTAHRTLTTGPTVAAGRALTTDQAPADRGSGTVRDLTTDQAPADRGAGTVRDPFGAGGAGFAGLVAVALAVGIGALDGHAAVAGEAVAAAVHALAASVWIGGVIALAAAGWPLLAGGSPARPEPSLRPLARALLGAYTVPAVVSVVALGVTGPVLAGRQIATPYAAVTTPYGLILAAKLLVLGGVAVIAVLSARGRSGRRPLIMEAVLLGAVACCAALLTVTPPARGPGLEPAPAAAPLQRSVRLDDLVLEVSVRPGTPGRNLVTVEVHDTRRPAPGTVRAVRLGLPGSAPGTLPLTERRWQATADLPPAQGVPIRVDVVREGLPPAGTTLEWTIRGAEPHGFMADQPLVPITNGLAWAISAVAAAVLALVWRRRRHHEISGDRPDHAADLGRARAGA